MGLPVRFGHGQGVPVAPRLLAEALAMRVRPVQCAWWWCARTVVAYEIVELEVATVVRVTEHA
jgi:hypothetical protein